LAVTAFKFLIINYYIPWCLNIAYYLYRALQDKLMVANGHELFRDTVTALSPEPFHISIKVPLLLFSCPSLGLQNRCSVNIRLQLNFIFISGTYEGGQRDRPILSGIHCNISKK